jgi:hypothetical protein
MNLQRAPACFHSPHLCEDVLLGATGRETRGYVLVHEMVADGVLSGIAAVVVLFSARGITVIACCYTLSKQCEHITTLANAHPQDGLPYI